MKKKFSLYLSGILIGLGVTSTPLSADEQDILASISNEMTRYEHVATETKNNERYQPYIISVFEGKDLEKLGIKDLEEALGLVPGVDMATDNFNIKTPIFRGSNPRAYGQSKLFIDGTLVNEVFFDSYSQYLSMPVEMIKRIEVTRGPGSKTDGVNAYAGSIHVITYKEEFEGFRSKDKVVLKGGSYDYMMGGFVKSYKVGDLKIHTDFFYQQDDKTVKSGPDGFSQAGFSLSSIYDNSDLSKSGDAPVWMKNWNLGLALDYKDFYIKARNLDHTQGSAWGINWALPDKDNRQKMPSQYLEVGYDGVFSDFELNIKAGVKNDAWDSKARLTPDGFRFINYIKYINSGGTDIEPITFAEGGHGKHSASQQTKYQSSFLKYNGLEDHKFSIGYRYFKEETYEMTSLISDYSNGDPTPIDQSAYIPFLDEDASRETKILSIQDEYYASDALSLIYGVSHEKTTYTKEVYDPRVSLVYQYDMKNIYKVIYSQSHRNPSWQEMFTQYNAARQGSTDLEPERVTAYEAAYIHKFSADSYLQSNLFYLENKNQIYNIPPDFYNVLDTDIYGFELEYKGNFTSSDQFYMNYSYVGGEDDNGIDKTGLANVAHHMAKAYYIYNLDNGLSLSTIAKHVGPKERQPSDTRDRLNAYTKVDAAIRYYDRADDYHVTLSAKNVFNADIRYPSPPPPDTYIDDFRQEETNFLLTIGKEW